MKMMKLGITIMMRKQRFFFSSLEKLLNIIDAYFN